MKKKKKGIFVNLLMIVTILFSSLLLFGVIYIWDTMGDSYQPIDRINDEDDTDTQAGSSRNTLEDPVNILLLGVDSNQTSTGRSDTIMVLRLHPEDRTVTVVSLPRDTYTEIIGRGYKDKVNHSMNYGIPTVVASVENFFDIHIDYYATIDFRGFKKAIDALDGVEIDVEKRMKYTDVAGGLYIDLQPGLQTLNGEQALGYARFRHDALGDLGRIQRQQKVIKAVLDKSTDIRSSTHVFELIDIVGDHFKTDIPRTSLLKILTTYHNVTSQDFISEEVKGESKRFGEQNLWYFVVSKEERKRLHEILIQD